MPIDSKCPEYSEWVPDWEDCRAFYMGERTVKGLGKRFLPKPEGSTKKEYDNYVMRAFFFGAMERTVNGIVGAINRKSPHIKIPSRLKQYEDLIDLNGNSLRQFSKECLQEVMITGRFGILPERPKEGDGPGYLVLYKAEDIINWVVDPYGNVQLVVVREEAYKTAVGDKYAQIKTVRYRELFLEDGVYMQRVHELDTTAKKGSYTVTEEITPTINGKTFDYIPFIFCGPNTVSARIDKPPLLDLQKKNAEHYRVGADYANSLYFVGNPFIYVAGLSADEAGKIVLGSSKAVALPDPEARIEMVECSGHGVSPCKDKCDDIKMEMAVLGARLLEGQRQGVEAAETVRLRQSGDTSVMSSLVISVSEAIEHALGVLAKWENVGEEVEFKLNEDFLDVQMDPQMLSALKELVNGGLISWETFFYNLARGELIPEGVSQEDEKSKIQLGNPMPRPMEMVNNDTSGGFNRNKPGVPSGGKSDKPGKP